VTTDDGFPARLLKPGSRSGWISILLLAALLFAWVRAPLVSVPLERDEGEYAYIAQRALEGDVPYRDAFDQKPPGVFVAYAAAFLVFGESVEGIHGFMYLWTALTALVLFGCVRRLAGPTAGAFAVLVFAVVSADPRLTANAANTEIFMLLPLVTSLYCAQRALEVQRAFRWWLLAGVAAGAACWFKQVAITNAVFLAAIPLVAAVPGRRGRGAAWVRDLGGLLLGAVLVSAPVIAAFVAVGAWADFADAVFFHNLAYSRSNSWPAAIGLLQLRLAEQAPGLGVCWALAAAGLLVPGAMAGRTRALLGGWLAAALLGISIGFFFRPHYFIQMLPALAALCGVTLAAAVEASRTRFGAGAGALAGTLAVALAAVPPGAAGGAVRGAGSPTAISREIYGSNPFPESVAIASYIRRTSGADDRVYIVGSEPQILFYAGRISATRYIFFYPLTGGYPGALEEQRSVIAEVEAARPLYVVWSNIATSLLVDDASETWILTQTKAMLDREYRLEFVAHPIPGQAAFEFVYGVEARRLMRQARERADQAPWIALYRRHGR
jgi:hypothetical protein